MANPLSLSLKYWNVDEPFASRVRFTPLTGRTHQLRIHSRQIGHSILGDDLYGLKEHDEAGRLMLHATTLAFNHPVTGERLEWECVAVLFRCVE